MSMILETRHNDGFIVSVIDTGRLSFDEGQLAAGQKVPAGTVLGQVLGTSANYEPLPGNTGDGGFGTAGVTVGIGAMTGVYILTLTSPTAFEIAEPSGTFLAPGTVGTAYDTGGLSFTLSAGAIPFVAGDGFSLGVGGQYAAWDPTASDGSETATAIALNNTDATLGQCNIGVLARLAEINATEVVWGPNVTTLTQQAMAFSQLRQQQIIARPGAGIATYQ